MIGNSWMLMALTAEQLFSLLTLTYKYDVKDYMKFCCGQLRRDMREDRALRILQLESYLQTEEDVQSLTNYVIKYIGTIQTRPLQVETKGYFISKYRDLERFERSLFGFPLNIIEAIISSDVLEVRTEDVVYNFLCKWAKAKYSQSQRPVKVFKFNLPQPGCIVYFDIPHMVCRSMLLSGDVYSQKIELGQHGTHVFAACQHEPPQMEHSFGLFWI
ncbi:hypothetical protein HanPI659440_Chr11g0437921 [Helianthus annuus]|nr:hypothetical protein HanPI659440_Chr11g0437921 [Helianthus annuus]